MNFEDLAGIEKRLERGEASVKDLYILFDRREPVPESAEPSGKPPTGARQIAWLQHSVLLSRQFTDCALEKEELLLVCDVASETERQWKACPDEPARTDLVHVLINHATALARLGFYKDARDKLEPYVHDNCKPALSTQLKADIMRRLGNILRDESQEASTRSERVQKAEQALEFYNRSLELEPEHVETLALSAAASLLLDRPGSGLRDTASEKARRILQLSQSLPEKDRSSAKTLRLLAIAHAVLGELAAATQAYRGMRSAPGVTPPLLADARYYAQFVAQTLGKPRNFFDNAFPPLNLVVFVGHMPDLPDHAPRMPNSSLEQVRQTIRKKVEDEDIRVGFVSAAAGADLLFSEALLDRGGIIHIVLPWAKEEFLKTSVRPYEPAGSAPIWEPRFKRALDEATTVRVLGQLYQPNNDVNWRYLTEVTAGLAFQAARNSRLGVQPMILWDRSSGRGPGGTSDFFEFWGSDMGREPMVIDLPVPKTGGGQSPDRSRHSRSELSTIRHEVKSMLFADIVGYSKLQECVIPEFVENFMAKVSMLVARSKHAPRCINTWGDAIYAVFDFASDAGAFAMELTEMIVNGKEDWLKAGLYSEEYREGSVEPIRCPLNIRIGLHTGPVFRHYDPVVRQLGFTGAHVNRAARIEPVAKPGQVFASEEFAALAELDGVLRQRLGAEGAEAGGLGFVCQYAGSLVLAKAYPGRHRIYRVVPRRVFAIEELARTVHELYLDECRARNETPSTNGTMQPWNELSDDLREANRAQVVDIPNKLRFLGYELSPAYGLPPSEIRMTRSQIEDLAIEEHDRWMKEKLGRAWVYGEIRDNARKHHPLLVPWDKLSETEKDKDRDTVRNLPALVAKAGFSVRKLTDKQ